MILEGSGGGFDAIVQAIDRVIALQEGVGEMKGALVASLAEPGLLLAATYATTIWMAITFETQVFAAVGGNIPPSTFTGVARQLLEVGNFGQSIWGWLAPIVVLALLVLMVWRLPRGKGWFRNLLDRIPLFPWSIYRSVQGAAWLQSFAMLSQSGFSHLQVLERMSVSASPWLREKLNSAAFFVKRGEKIGMALRLAKIDFPSKEVIDDLVAFGSRPGFEEALQRLGEAWMKQTTRNVKGLAAALGMIAMVLSAGAILWIALGSQDLIQQMGNYLQSRAGVGM
jgi:type II secretory pathway component PulF